MSTAPAWHPLDPDATEDPYPFYAALRRAPVQPIEGFGMWGVSRYADVVNVLRHPELFSSSPMRAALSRPETFVPEEERTRSVTDAETLIGSDPPAHTRIRKIANRGFTPARIAALEPRIREIARALVDDFAARGACDVVADFAVPLPIAVIAELLGVDPERRNDFKRWSDALVRAAFDPLNQEESADVRACIEQWGEHFDGVLEARRRKPAEDVISALLREEDEGALGPEEITSLIGTLLVAGNVTTTNLIANAIAALLRHPEQLAKLEGDLSLVPGLVEEALRYDPPVKFLPRATTREVELSGTAIPAGTGLAVFFASANRDERRFPDPDRFDLTRDASGHVAFGLGSHFCLGAPLARLEARVAFEELFSRIRTPHLAEARIRWTRSLILRGPERLRIAFEERTP